jgi:hypothetical protein
MNEKTVHCRAIPDEHAELVQTGQSHVQGDDPFAILLPQEEVVEASEPWNLVPDIGRQLVDLLSDGLVCLGKEILQNRIIPVSHQVLPIRLVVVRLISEEKQSRFVRHGEVGLWWVS